MDSEWTSLIYKSTNDHVKSSKIGALIICYLELIFGAIGVGFALTALPGTADNGALWLTVFILFLVICPLSAIYGIHQNVIGWVIVFLVIVILNTTVNFIQALRVSIEDEKTKYALGQWFIFAFNCCAIMVLYAYCRDVHGTDGESGLYDVRNNGAVDVNRKTINRELKYPEI